MFDSPAKSGVSRAFSRPHSYQAEQRDRPERLEHGHPHICRTVRDGGFSGLDTEFNRGAAADDVADCLPLVAATRYEQVQDPAQ